MRETDAEVEYLQRLMDDTFAGANPHMTSIVTPEKRLRATQVVRYLDGIKYAAFGSVTQAGEPRVSPLDTLFVRGRFTLSTDGSTARVTNLRHNPACSLVHMVGDTIAIVVHGSVEWIARDHPDHDEIQSIWSSAYSSDLYSWGSEIVLFRAEPVAMWAYAQRPSQFPE
ncbi:MAG: pyridoxamine 5'-phosphate oxidase family protein [Candidatus Limnocylindria bacterium]